MFKLVLRRAIFLSVSSSMVLCLGYKERKKCSKEGNLSAKIAPCCSEVNMQFYVERLDGRISLNKLINPQFGLTSRCFRLRDLVINQHLESKLLSISSVLIRFSTTWRIKVGEIDPWWFSSSSKIKQKLARKIRLGEGFKCVRCHHFGDSI